MARIVDNQKIVGTVDLLDTSNDLLRGRKVGIFVGNFPVFDLVLVQITEDAHQPLRLLDHAEVIALPGEGEELDVDIAAAVAGGPGGVHGELQLAPPAGPRDVGVRPRRVVGRESGTRLRQRCFV